MVKNLEKRKRGTIKINTGEEKETPGFEAIFAIVGLLAYLLGRR